MRPTESRPPPVPVDRLRFEPFEHRRQLESFDCGNQGLNDFILNDDEVFSYQADFKSRTWLIREIDGWEVVGYYATYPSTLHQTHVKKPLMFLDLKVLAEHLGIRPGGFPEKQVLDRH